VPSLSARGTRTRPPRQPGTHSSDAAGRRAHRVAADIAQLDVLVHGVRIEAERRRFVEDFVDHNRADFGPLCPRQGVGFLGDKMLETVAGYVMAEGDAVKLRPELGALAIPRDIGAVPENK